MANFKVAVVAANGKAGSKIVEEAVGRGIDVTAMVRSKNKTAAQHAIVKDLFDLTTADLKGFDVVIDAFGTFKLEDLPEHMTSMKHLADALSGTNTRLLMVGGAGSLYTNPEHTQQLKDGADFPKEALPLSTMMGKTLEQLRLRDDVRWTYVSPAANFVADGPRTGHYLLRGEEYSTNDRGESTISYADYAIGLVDEAVSGNHIHQRISLIGA
ncbi:dihydrodipicolinate reductase [Bombiscardovia apis]|uniref:Dihydrodipicolinate reductase n=1 Tax=Bombiscardovia apis TaxID=2932182 RepID=A0ABM8BBZ0_9BIFI|nr:NAD(P)H-binding protein [Bombiscardovia apis]BDR54438.1 dihydrodipicolinate reductase [Bombiscardovia apis]